MLHERRRGKGEAILAAVEVLCRRRAITEPLDPMDTPGQYMAHDTAPFTGRAAALANIKRDHDRIIEIIAKLPTR
jgi:hypothetical protein